MPKASINDLEVYYESAGEGPPLVLISGVSSDHTGWKGLQLPAVLSAGYRCILFDNRDVGQTSESPVAHYSIEQFADDTAALLRHINSGPAHIVGASMGGMIGQVLALKHPECVRSLTLVCTTARPDAYMRHAIGSWKIISALCDREQLVGMRIPWLFTHRWFENAEAMSKYMERVLSNPFPQTMNGLSDIRVPTHVIVGAEDILIPPRHSQLLAAKIPGARLTVVPETGHCLFWETPSQFNAAMLGFLADVSCANASPIGRKH
jgi:3-oxoadipate enol-lactonase